MNFLFVLAFLLGGTNLIDAPTTNVSSFDNSGYSENIEIVHLLNDDFQKDVESPELKESLSEYLELRFEKIEHITANESSTSEQKYFAVYGTTETEKSVLLLKIDKSHFENETYYSFSTQLDDEPTCREGNGNGGFWCPPVCDKYPVGSCLGYTCPPGDCLGF